MFVGYYDRGRGRCEEMSHEGNHGDGGRKEATRKTTAGRWCAGDLGGGTRGTEEQRGSGREERRICFV